MSWSKEACTCCSKKDCVCRECSWNYTNTSNELECCCRKPSNRKCLITGTLLLPNEE